MVLRQELTVSHVFIGNVFVVAAAERRCVILRCAHSMQTREKSSTKKAPHV